MKVSIHLPGDPGLELTRTVGASLGVHLIVLMFLGFSPAFLPSGTSPRVVYTVNLVDLPPTPQLPAISPRAASPSSREEKEQVQPETVPEPEVPKPPPKPKPEAVKPVERKPTEKKMTPPKPRPKPVQNPVREPAGDTAGSPNPVLENPPAEETGVGSGVEQGPAAGNSGPGIEGQQTQTGFDDASFQYTYYVNRMVSILRSQWNKPIRPAASTGNLRTVIYFVIARDGNILRSELEESSGYQPLDLSALRAVRETRRMPPLPLQYNKTTLGVHFFFELKPEEHSPSRFERP